MLSKAAGVGKNLMDAMRTRWVLSGAVARTVFVLPVLGGGADDSLPALSRPAAGRIGDRVT
jgi:hypothetical protein